MCSINLCAATYDRVDSYGRIADELSRGLQAHGWHVNEMSLSRDARQTLLQWTDSGIFLGLPPNYTQFGGSTLKGSPIAITMFESTGLPEGWAKALNRRCAAVIVPSQFLVRVFRENGVKIPIHVVPLGVSEAFHQTAQRSCDITEDTPFTVLGIADRGLRKNWHTLTFAFYQAFKHDMRYRLILKSRTGVINFDLSNPNIQVIAEDYTDEEQAALYQRCHLMAFPTHGEGFGLPPREFAATGGIVIATDWGGTADELSCWGVPLSAGMERAFAGRMDFKGDLGDWAAPTVDALASLLQHVADQYAWYQESYEGASDFVISHYRWEHFVCEVERIYRLYNH